MEINCLGRTKNEIIQIKHHTEINFLGRTKNEIMRAAARRAAPARIAPQGARYFASHRRLFLTAWAAPGCRTVAIPSAQRSSMYRGVPTSEAGRYVPASVSPPPAAASGRDVCGQGVIVADAVRRHRWAQRRRGGDTECKGV